MSFSRSQNLRPHSLFANRPGIYLLIVVLSAVLGAIYGVRRTSLFACQPPSNETEAYLAYCQATGYGDYDYGAFWFGLEPAALRSASEAEVLFLGNSRLQFALSSDVVEDWFVEARTSFYLLGFAYDGNYLFAEPLLNRLHPKAKAYVINLDLFFEIEQTPPAQSVLYDISAESRYQQKRRQQRLHFVTCSNFPATCGRESAIYRTRSTGRWSFDGAGPFEAAPVSYDEQADPSTTSAYIAAARLFLATLGTPAECQILTVVPTVETPIELGRKIAESIGRPFVAPRLEGLETYDSSHLNKQSAEVWSTEFMSQAAPTITRCLAAPSSATTPTK